MTINKLAISTNSNLLELRRRNGQCFIAIIIVIEQVPESPLALSLFDAGLWQHFVHILDWDWLFIVLKVVLSGFFFRRVELVSDFGLRLSFFFPQIFHCCFEVFNLFSQLVFLVCGDKLKFIFFFFNRMCEHAELLPVLVDTVVESFFFDIVDDWRDVWLDIISHVKNFLKVFIQVIHLNVCKLNVLVFFLTQIMQVLIFHLGQDSQHLVIVRCCKLNLGVVMGFDIAELVAGVIMAAFDIDKVSQELRDLFVEWISSKLIVTLDWFWSFKRRSNAFLWLIDNFEHCKSLRGQFRRTYWTVFHFLSFNVDLKFCHFVSVVLTVVSNFTHYKLYLIAVLVHFFHHSDWSNTLALTWELRLAKLLLKSSHLASIIWGQRITLVLVLVLIWVLISWWYEKRWRKVVTSSGSGSADHGFSGVLRLAWRTKINKMVTLRLCWVGDFPCWMERIAFEMWYVDFNVFEGEFGANGTVWGWLVCHFSWRSYRARSFCWAETFGRCSVKINNN